MKELSPGTIKKAQLIGTAECFAEEARTSALRLLEKYERASDKGHVPKTTEGELLRAFRDKLDAVIEARQPTSTA